jgi:Eukaryotic aspartyl protease
MNAVFAFIGIDTPLSREPFWILGNVFMRIYYTVFDRGTSERSSRMGFELES